MYIYKRFLQTKDEEKSKEKLPRRFKETGTAAAAAAASCIPGDLDRGTEGKTGARER